MKYVDMIGTNVTSQTVLVTQIFSSTVNVILTAISRLVMDLTQVTVPHTPAVKYASILYQETVNVILDAILKNANTTVGIVYLTASVYQPCSVMEFANMKTVTTKHVDLMMVTVTYLTVIAILSLFTTANVTTGVILRNVIMIMMNVFLEVAMYVILIVSEIITVIQSVISKFASMMEVTVLLTDASVLLIKCYNVILTVIPYNANSLMETAEVELNALNVSLRKSELYKYLIAVLSLPLMIS